MSSLKSILIRGVGSDYNGWLDMVGEVVGTVVYTVGAKLGFVGQVE